MPTTGPQPIQPGSVLFGKYRVEETLGRGGMGLVVKARHLGLDEEVAIKLLRDDVTIDNEAIARFLREAQAAVKLKSEHVCRITDVGRFDDGKPYMIMEYLQGHDIGQMVEQQGSLTVQLAVDLVLQACDALAEAHANGIIHRDVKPSNLFVTFRADGSAILKVLDFGISKSANQDLSLTQTQSMLGSPAYMSPEQMRSARKVDARTDIWSLGSVLYEAIEGHIPFFAESFGEMCVKVAVEPPEPMVKTPPELQAVILRCLAKQPEQRYASVAELGAELVRFSRDPQAARALVERMQRIAQRGGTGVGMAPYQGSGPIAIPAGMPPRAITAEPIGSGPIEAPRPRSKAWLLIPFGLLAVVATIVIVALASGGGGAVEPGSGSANVASPGSGSAAGSGSGSAERPSVVTNAGSGSGSGSAIAAQVGDGSGSAAADAGSDAGSGSATGPIHEQSGARETRPGGGVRVPPKGNATVERPGGDGSGSAKQPCDPFGSRVNCK